MTRFVPVDRDQRMLLPIDLGEWIAEDDLAHLVIEAVERVPVSRFRVNARGSGAAQYHPRMMLALLVYCYAQGLFSSRRIEPATYRDVGVRFVAANRHPDHDTICKFRRGNEAAIREAFLQVLLLARAVGLLRLGLVSVDGTQVDANASRHRNVRYDRAGALVEQLRAEISQLLERAEGADREAAGEDERLPAELSRREVLVERLEAARARLQAKDRERAERDRPAYEAKVAARAKRPGRRKGKRPKPPSDTPREEEQGNLTDPDSGLMRKSRSHEFRQRFNAQAAVDAGGSQLVLGARIAGNASDRNALVASVDAIPPALGMPGAVLADNGYANGADVAALQGRGVEVLVATSAEGRRRRHDFRPEPAPRVPPTMRARLEQPELRAKYRLRKQTVEPVFGVLKRAIGFTYFRLRGFAGAEIEWQLATLAYTCRRMHRMQAWYERRERKSPPSPRHPPSSHRRSTPDAETCPNPACPTPTPLPKDPQVRQTVSQLVFLTRFRRRRRYKGGYWRGPSRWSPLSWSLRYVTFKTMFLTNLRKDPAMPSLSKRILAHASALPEAAPLCPGTLLHLGNRAAVDQALSRLARSGRLIRLCQGVYMLPVETRFGLRPPVIEKAITALSALWGETIVPCGASAANLLGLITQMPVRLVYLTSGPDRRLRFGAQTVALRHVPRWQLTAPYRPAGDAVRALAWLGPREVEDGLCRVARRLSVEDLDELAAARATMPAWMAEPVSALIAHG